MEDLSNIDKEILQVMIKNGCGHGRWLTTNEIADRSGYNWKTVHVHLNNLRVQKYTKHRMSGKPRSYDRGEKKVEAQRQIEWTLLVKEE
jgi:hypothetical protein